MQRRDFLKLLSLTPLAGLSSCAQYDARRLVRTGQNLAQGDFKQAITSQVPSTGIAELDKLVKQELNKLADRLAKKWGDKKVASPTEYVKYTDDYDSRALVNFDTGIIQVETLETKNSKAKLEKSIISTLLAPEDPSKVDLLSDKEVTANGEPFLHNLVLDHQGQPIRYQWRAEQYAKHLITSAYQTDKYNGKTRHFVTFKMVQNHQTGSQQKYSAYVQENSKRFKVKSSLIYAVIEAESSYNPYAMSHVPAYGLMQIVPSTAGRDSHQLIYNKAGTPTKDYLFVPANNIRMGSAYLSILNDRYLAKVTNPLAREYCVIAGYNTGAGNVLKAFNPNNRDQAFVRINQMTAQQVYNHLVKNLTYDEAKRYLQKVTQFQKKYV